MSSRSARFPTFSTIATGELAGVTSATQLPTVTARLVKIKASAANTGKVYIGISGVTVVNGTTDTTSGWQLSAKDETPWLAISNLNLLYRICDSTSDHVTYVVLS